MTKKTMTHRYCFSKHETSGIGNALKTTLSALAAAAAAAATIVALTTVALTTVALTTVALVGCVNPVAIPKKIRQTQAATAETPPMVGSTTDNRDGTYSFKFPLPQGAASNASIAARSLVNYEDTGGAFQTAINYYQLVLVDDANPGEVWASASASNSASNGTLSAIVMAGATYHFLLLHGHKDDPTDPNETPTLLGSGYIKYTILPGANTVLIRMVPVLIDATLTKASAADAWAMIGNTAWVKDENFDVTIKLRSRSANQDGNPAPHGNALWPLRLAEARGSAAVWAAFATTASPHYATTLGGSDGDPWTGAYWDYDGTGTPSVPTDVSLIANDEKVGVAELYYSEGNNPAVPISSRSASNSRMSSTTGSFTYTNIPTLRPYSQTTDYGKFSFALTYVPFGISTDASWRAAYGDNLTAAPKWTIGGDVYLAYRLYATAGGLSGSALSPTGIPTGISWASASKDLQYLADLASQAYAQDNAALKEIWAEAGTYKNIASGSVPAGSGTVVDISNGKNGVALYGGFKKPDTDDKRLAALGTRPADRSTWFKTYPTLAFDNEYGAVVDSARKTTIDASNGAAGNGAAGNGAVSAAVKVDGATNLALDGFTITRGTYSGLWIKDAPATTLFTNLELTGNAITGTGGGGILVENGAPVLDNLTVTGNTATGDWGGGIHIAGNSNALITNVFISGNVTDDDGGGIAIAGANPRLENIVVTGNRAAINGGGIYNHGTPVIVNALISGNTCNDASARGAQGTGGALYTTRGPMFLVNALISGNKTEIIIAHDSNRSFYGGGGIKVNDGQLNLINCTVSGNYASYNRRSDGNTDPLPGGGIYVVNMNGGSEVKAYNSLVLGNIGESGLRNDVATFRGGEFFAYNSLVGGYTVAQLNGGLGNDGTRVGAGSGNAEGTAYGYATIEATRLTNLKAFFTAFNALPTPTNTGKDRVADWSVNPLWDFHLRPGATGAVDSGSAIYLGVGYTTVMGGLTKDVAGNARIYASAPDMGAYESPYQSVGIGGSPFGP